MQYRLSRKFLGEILEFTADRFAGKISCPVLIIHGDRDNNVPIGQSERLFSHLPFGKKILVSLSGIDHVWRNPGTVSRDKKAARLAVRMTADWISGN